MNMKRNRVYMAMTATFLLGAVLTALIAFSLVRVSTANAAPSVVTQGIVCPGCNFSSGGSRFAGANFNDAFLDFSTFGPPIADMHTENGPRRQGADLTGTTFKRASLIGTDFAATTLDGVSFKNAILCGPGGGVSINTTEFVQAHGSNVNFTNLQVLPFSTSPCTFAKMDIAAAVFPNANFTGTSVELDENCNNTSTPPCSGLTYYVDFTGSDFTGAQLHSSTLTKGNFTGAIFQNAVFSDLTNSDSQTDISSSNFTNANLAGANLTHANFTQANLTGANFANANFTRANLRSALGLTPAALTGATWSSTICPDGTNSDDDGGTCVNNLG